MTTDLADDQRDLGALRPDQQAALIGLGLFRLACNAVVAVAESVAGLCILGWLIGQAGIGDWRYRRVADEAKVRSALAAAGLCWSTAERVRLFAGLTPQRSGKALRRLIRRGRVETHRTTGECVRRRYRLRPIGGQS